jgi:hypothetical protein
MPYTLRKKPLQNLYFIINKDTGKKISKIALPLKKAESQIKAIYASEAHNKK